MLCGEAVRCETLDPSHRSLFRQSLREPVDLWFLGYRQSLHQPVHLWLVGQVEKSCDLLFRKRDHDFVLTSQTDLPVPMHRYALDRIAIGIIFEDHDGMRAVSGRRTRLARLSFRKIMFRNDNFSVGS